MTISLEAISFNHDPGSATSALTIRQNETEDIAVPEWTQARMVVLQFPSRLVSSGDYVVSLAGRTPSGTYEPVADYPVRVSKK